MACGRHLLQHDTSVLVYTSPGNAGRLPSEVQAALRAPSHMP